MFFRASSLLVLLGFSLFLPLGVFAKIPLTQEGKSLCPIVVSANATLVQQTAAKELQEHLNLVTGGSFEIKKESEVGDDDAQIIIGPSPRMKKLLPDVDPAKFAYDEILIQTVGNKLLLAGHAQRGPLYAVNSFLEDIVGVRWWTSTENLIPKKPTLEVESLNIRYAPKLIYREAYYLDAFNGKFATQMKCNGSGERIPAEYGGHHQFVYFVHSFYPLLPPGKYFDEHPEWYSEIDGKRTHDHAQLCLTNDEMRAELVKNAKASLGKNPEAKFISISQNDWYKNCQCEKCKAVEEAEGSPSGLMIQFVNQVAEEIEKNFPDVWVETLAYQYTRKPPKHVRPRKNVVVRLCTIECSFVQPLTGDQNKTLCDDIEGWNKIAPQLFVWDYVTNFSNYIMPQPNMKVLAPNIRFFVKNGTIGLFEQGDSYCNIGDFVGLRNYVISHLMWNPDLDEMALFHDYMTHYYGAAAPYLTQYLKLIHDCAEDSQLFIGCFRKDTVGWLNLKAMNEATQLFEKAAIAVKDDPLLAVRVRKAKMILDHVWLMRYHDFLLESQLSDEPFPGPTDGKAACQEFFRLCKEWQTNAYREYNDNYTMEEYEKMMLSRFGDSGVSPEICQELSSNDWMDLQEYRMDILQNRDWAKIVDDASASNQLAIRMPGDHFEWATSCRITEGVAKAVSQWHVYAMVRCDASVSDGTAMTIGIYDEENKKGVLSREIPISEIVGKEYYQLDLGVHPLTTNMYIWAAPPKRPGEVDAVFVDRFFLVKDR